METREDTHKCFCRYCGSRLMVDIVSLQGKMVLQVKCTKCKKQNVITEEHK